MKTYKGDPPCHECDRPEIYPDNKKVWHCWSILSSYRERNDYGVPKKLKLEDVKNLAEYYDLTDIDFENLLALETKMHDMMVERWNADARSKDTGINGGGTKGRRNPPKRP